MATLVIPQSSSATPAIGPEMNIREMLKSRKKARLLAVGTLLLLLMAGLTATEMPLRLEIGIIHFYKSHISPVSSSFITCRFRPT